MTVQPYLFFDGRCEEALKFYQGAIGAEVQGMMRVKDAPESHGPTGLPEGSGDKIMHVAFKVGDAVLMASDGRCSGKPNFQGFGLALALPDVAAVDRAFNALAAGGSVEMPLAKTFFSARFGMLVDRFGVRWMVNMVP
jgi:PhnB protein